MGEALRLRDYAEHAQKATPPQVSPIFLSRKFFFGGWHVPMYTVSMDRIHSITLDLWLDSPYCVGGPPDSVIDYH